LKQVLADTAAGKTYTIFRSKPKKALADSHTPLSEESRAKLMNMVDSFDTMFNNDVQASRSNLTLQKLVDLGGDTVMAQEGVSLGLIDSIVLDLQDGITSALKFKNSAWKSGSKTSASSSTKLSTLKGTTMNEEELKLALSEAQADNLKVKAEAITAVSMERDRASRIVASAKTLNMSFDTASKHITKGYDAETSLEIMTEIAENKASASSIDTTGGNSATDPDLDTKLTGVAGVAVVGSGLDALRNAAKAAGIPLKVA